MKKILFTAPKSGSGKTMITCAIIKAFMIKGLKVSAFKCGPDYIDPMFHQNVLGAKTGNLDTFFCSDNFVRYLLKEEGGSTDIAVMEGVMGYYDGLGGVSDKASTYDVARVTKTPAVLILDCRGLSLTSVAVIKGMIEYRENSQIKGVILNRISVEHYSKIKKMIEDELNIKVYGFLPQINFTIKSRHLGLVTPNEVEGLQHDMYMLAIKVIETVDIDGLIELAESAEYAEYDEPTIPRLDKPVRLAVAKDAAFCFYYNENLSLFEKMGAEIIEFSPLDDKALPEDIDGLIIGGGYPELFAKELSTNSSMRKSILTALEGGMPCIAECGGFLYLQESLENVKGLAYPMVGFLKGHGIQSGRLVRFGYITIQTEEKTVFGDAGVTFRGHEFHHWDSTVNGDCCSAVKPIRNKKWECCVSKNNTFAGFPHIHFYSNIEAAFEFLKRCGDRK